MLAVACLALLASACQLSLASDIAVSADGSGSFELAVAVDEELAELLSDAGVDLALGLDDAQATATGWQVEEVDEAPGRELRFRTGFDSPDELGALVEELHAGLGEADPAVLRDVHLEVADDGSARFRADAGLQLPTTTGVSGDAVAFDAEDLAALLEEEGARAARYDLRLELPGRPSEHDADAREGRTLVWSLPIGEMRSIEARSEPTGSDRTGLLLATTFLVSAAVAVLAVVLTRRRRARRPRH